MDDQELLTIAQVAKLTKVSRSKLYQYVTGEDQPVLPSIRVGTLRRFRRTAVEDWLKAFEDNHG